MPDEHLAALATLHAVWETERQSYSDLLRPFVLASLEEDAGGLRLDEIAARMQSVFGFELPRGVLDAALKSSVEKGLAAERNETYRASAKIGETFTQARAKAERQLENLVKDLQAYVVGGGYGSWDQTRARAALTQFVRLNATHLKDGQVEISGFGAGGSGHGDEVVVAEWVRLKLDSDQTRTEYLEQYVMGNALAAAVFDSRREGYDRKFSDTSVYLDTPEVLSLLGMHGTSAKEITQDAVKIAAAGGAAIAVWESTLVETRGTLDGAATTSLNSSAPPTRVERYIWSKGMSGADVRQLSVSIEAQLKRHNVAVRSAPPTLETNSVDEPMLARALQSAVGYQSPGTRDKDVRALTATYRARDRREGDRLERCRAVLVSSNPKMVRGANGTSVFGAQGYPVALFLGDFATLMWLRKPEGFPEMPRDRLALDCVALLKPSATTFAHFERIARGLAARGPISADDVTETLLSNELQNSLATREATGRKTDEAFVGEEVRRIADLRSRRERDLEQTLAGVTGELETRTSEAARLAVRTDRLDALLRGLSVFAGWVVRLGAFVVWLAVVVNSRVGGPEKSGLGGIAVDVIVAVVTLLPYFVGLGDRTQRAVFALLQRATGVSRPADPVAAPVRTKRD